MNLPLDYYHCFLGNGRDAVLIGYTGAMVPMRAQGYLDRCVWYKADRYYPEDRLVQINLVRRSPGAGPLEHAEGSGWYELAPLGRTWYEVHDRGLRLDLRAGSQRFVPQEGTLYSEVDYGRTRARVTTFLHASRPLLVMRYEFDRPVDFRAWMGAGVWLEEGYDTNPFLSVEADPAGPVIRYDLGASRGMMALGLAPSPVASGRSGQEAWLEVHAAQVTHYFGIADDHEGALDETVLAEALSTGYEVLCHEHQSAWQGYFDRSVVAVPDPVFQRFYDSSLYLFKAAQHPVSGGLPVNNLRLTWSSHIFWDAYFLHRPLLEANRLGEALEACRFFQRTLDHARRHAHEEFGAPGLKWDWEITHRAQKAYGTWLHQKEQVHNNASYANMIWDYYAFTRDRDYLAEFYPILRGLAEFFLAAVVVETERGHEIRPLVGVHESPDRVQNEGFNVSAAIRILRLAARAAALLDRDGDFADHCQRVAGGLTQTLDRLYNGRYFMSHEGSNQMNMASLAPIYPMRVVTPTDPRAISTARAYLGWHDGRRVTHGNSTDGFPWSAGVLATILARQGAGEAAWSVIQGTAEAIGQHGGMSETVYEDGGWNMQYFGTAQGAVCTALHQLLLQADGEEVRVFPALPSAWERCSFERLRAGGLEVSAAFQRGEGIEGELVNVTSGALSLRLAGDGRAEDVALDPGQRHGFRWAH